MQLHGFEDTAQWKETDRFVVTLSFTYSSRSFHKIQSTKKGQTLFLKVTVAKSSSNIVYHNRCIFILLKHVSKPDKTSRQGTSSINGWTPIMSTLGINTCTFCRINFVTWSCLSSWLHLIDLSPHSVVKAETLHSRYMRSSSTRGWVSHGGRRLHVEGQRQQKSGSDWPFLMMTFFSFKHDPSFEAHEVKCVEVWLA